MMSTNVEMNYESVCNIDLVQVDICGTANPAGVEDNRNLTLRDAKVRKTHEGSCYRREAQIPPPGCFLKLPQDMMPKLFKAGLEI